MIAVTAVAAAVAVAATPEAPRDEGEAEAAAAAMALWRRRGYRNGTAMAAARLPQWQNGALNVASITLPPRA